MQRVFLKPDREKKIQRFYPWVPREEVSRVAGQGEDGDVAELLTSKGEFVALGTYNSKPRFPFRVFTLQREDIDPGFFRKRINHAVARRASLPEPALRLIHSEADGLPGLIVDRFGPHLVVQVRSLGMAKMQDLWLTELMEATGAESAYERSDMEGRREEGLEPVSAPMRGKTPDEIEIQEDELVFKVRPQAGLKTGFFMDQRATRRRFEQRLQPGENVLDCFCYTGAFTLRAAWRKANVTGIDILPEALQMAQINAQANELEPRFIEANAFEYLEHAEEETLYDWIVLDPPAISKTGKTKDSLKWAIWNLVYHALPRLKPGGRLVVCSCSYQLSLNGMLDTCRLAAADRGRPLALEEVTYQDWDHPAPLHFPEALYLKCAWLRAD